MDLDDDSDSEIFDDFQDEYPFEINLPPEHLNDINNMNNDDDDENDEDNDMNSQDSNNDALIKEAEADKILEEFSLESFSNELLKNAGTGDLLTCLNKHWAKYVPICYRATENPTRNMIEKDVDRVLFKPFEIFICNNQNSDKIIEELKQLDDPPILCGHVFKSGEPSYFCRDCGSDPTCVLCSDCFLNSKHRSHKYKMTTSAGGGGYCDCGDVEAWKFHPSCSIHTKKDDTNEIQTPDDAIEKLPKDLVQRSRQLFDYLLEYVIDMICGDHKEVLPAHLKGEIETDEFITVLFNDEIHSYEQVTRTLKNVLNVDDQRALEYATIVDKDGRSSIKCGKKSQCQAIKTQVETIMTGHMNTTPLETKVMHQYLISHQYFAEKIISWLKKFTECSKALKHVLCQIGFTNRIDNYSLIEKLILSDCLLWKSARNAVHQFFIAIYFMDTNWKKEFATLYTKNYQLIWRNYVKNPDDTISLTDLAVQLFTVISLSKYLITNYNLLQIIMDTLIEQSKMKLNNVGRLQFERGRLRNTSDFKRAQFILFDLKYCLISIPESFDNALRESFLNGFRSFSEFLKYMHGMDPVKRCVGQHIEYEPEWETGFNLLIKLQKSTQSIIEWCTNDREILFKAYNHLLQILFELESSNASSNFKYESRKIFSKEYRIIEYDIMTQEISIHAPLTRLLAALHKSLNKFAIKYDDFKLVEDEQIRMNALIEPSLRSLAMAAQINVGLWRRNGYSLLSQVYFYQNVKCRTEMYDRDIECLQMGASVMEANDFIVSVLSRFRLIDYITKDNPETKADETKLEFLNVLFEEFLQLLITIIGERYDSCIGNVSKQEKLKREVVHQLCISPMAHSDIIKNIYPDSVTIEEEFVEIKKLIENYFHLKEVNSNDLEEVLREVAIFKNAPNASNKGTYELKPQFYDEYNSYFYHYSRIEKTKSEEYVLKQKPATKRFLAAPIPPTLKPHYLKLKSLLHCDIFLKILNLTLKRFHTKSKVCTDGQLVRLLHLIGMAVNEENGKLSYEMNGEGFKFCEKISKQKSNDSLITHLKQSIPLITTEPYKLLANWVLHSLENLCSKVNSSSSIRSTSDTMVSRDISMKTEEEETKEKAKEKRKSQTKIKAEQRRLKILAQMSEMQKDFIKKNKDFFEEATFEVDKEESSIVDTDVGFDHKNCVCLGPNQTHMQTSSTVKRYRCILCQEDQEISLKNPPMVLCAYIIHSKILSKDFHRNIENIDKFDPLFMPSSRFWGVYTSTCGHVMHGSCWQKYVDGVKANEHRRHIGRLHNFDVKRNEFLCPLCETIGNTVLPLLPNFKEFTNHGSKVIDITFDDWLDGLKNTLDHSIQKELNDDKDTFIMNPFPLSSITKFMAEAVARNFNQLFSYGLNDASQQSNEPKILDDMSNIIDIFARSAFVFGMVAHPNDDDLRMPLTTWNNCAYTIQVIEQILQVENKPVFSQLPARQATLLSNLIKFASLYAIGKNMNHVRENCLKLLAAILPYNSVFYDTINIMDCDSFHLLVYLCFSMPYLYDNTTLSSIPCGNINEAYIFRLILQVHCVQILLKKIQLNTFEETIEKNYEFVDLCNESNNAQELKVYDLFEYLLKISNKKNENFVKPSAKIVTLALKIALMPFLRCSVLFFNFMTDIVPPSTDNDPDMESYNYFCNYLGISKDISILLDLNNSFFRESVNKWSTLNSKLPSKQIIDHPFQINQLQSLPNDYIDLISSFSKLSANLTEQDPSSIICLICGETLNNNKFGHTEEIGNNKVGLCTAHAFKCGRTVGVFLRVVECRVLLLHLNINAENEISARGSFIPAPYLDDYGETDELLRRGNPLRLCLSRYKKLHHTWLSHSIPNEVSRSYQNNQSLMSNNEWVLY